MALAEPTGFGRTAEICADRDFAAAIVAREGQDDSVGLVEQERKFQRDRARRRESAGCPTRQQAGLPYKAYKVLVRASVHNERQRFLQRI